MYLPNFLDGFDRLVAFDAETTGTRTPDAEFVRKQPFAWRAPGITFGKGEGIDVQVLGLRSNALSGSGLQRLSMSREGLLGAPTGHAAVSHFRGPPHAMYD
jgi:hypothetical protein